MIRLALGTDLTAAAARVFAGQSKYVTAAVDGFNKELELDSEVSGGDGGALSKSDLGSLFDSLPAREPRYVWMHMQGTGGTKKVILTWIPKVAERKNKMAASVGITRVVNATGADNHVMAFNREGFDQLFGLAVPQEEEDGE